MNTTVGDAAVKVVDDGPIGGWVRALVASGLGMLSGMGWFNDFIPYFTESFKEAVATIVAVVAVGSWSWVAKTVSK